MKTVISAKDIEDVLRRGGELESLPADAVYTPSARDLLHDLQKRGRMGDSRAAPCVAARPLTSKSPPAELEAFFNSAHGRSLKEQMCDIGRRLWQRAYVDGNG